MGAEDLYSKVIPALALLTLIDAPVVPDGSSPR